MTEDLSFEAITPKVFDACLNRYEDVVPEKLRELDEFRFVTIPAELKARREAKGGAWLAKEEVQKLVDWKLKHGTFRPSLPKLVASNSEEDVISTTRTAFDTNGQTPRKMVDQIAKLKGIGPATAALLASCFDPENMPFFSDEMFRWMHWDGKNSDGTNNGIKQGGKGWSRQIGYTMKEYESLRLKGEQLQKRLKADPRPVNFLDIEKVAYVLGKEKAAIGKDGVLKIEEANDDQKQKAMKKNEVKQKPFRASAETENKRKAVSQDPPETRRKRTRAKKVD